MKIERIDTRKVPLSDIDIGGIFEINGVLYIKTTSELNNAVSLNTGVITGFTKNALVLPVKASVVVEE